jgi:methionyl-tRNA synthetase
VAELDGYLSLTQPWKLEPSQQQPILEQAVKRILFIAHHLQVGMPQTARLITNHFSQPVITALTPLFPRLPI